MAYSAAILRAQRRVWLPHAQRTHRTTPRASVQSERLPRLRQILTSNYKDRREGLRGGVPRGRDPSETIRQLTDENLRPPAGAGLIFESEGV